MLNNVLTAQAAIIKRHGGDIDKYVGDELVAVFEGDDMAVRAVRAALDIQREVPMGLAAEDRGRITLGIGINTGEMIMGAMGSVERMDYTVIGDHVNLGARLCSAAEPGQILISERTFTLLASPDWCVITPLEPIKVKGKVELVKIWEIGARS
jgi:adenylate cyclase